MKNKKNNSKQQPVQELRLYVSPEKLPSVLSAIQLVADADRLPNRAELLRRIPKVDPKSFAPASPDMTYLLGPAEVEAD